MSDMVPMVPANEREFALALIEKAGQTTDLATVNAEKIENALHKLTEANNAIEALLTKKEAIAHYNTMGESIMSLESEMGRGASEVREWLAYEHEVIIPAATFYLYRTVHTYYPLYASLPDEKKNEINTLNKFQGWIKEQESLRQSIAHDRKLNLLTTEQREQQLAKEADAKKKKEDEARNDKMESRIKSTAKYFRDVKQMPADQKDKAFLKLAGEVYTDNDTIDNREGLTALLEKLAQQWLGKEWVIIEKPEKPEAPTTHPKKPKKGKTVPINPDAQDAKVTDEERTGTEG